MNETDVLSPEELNYIDELQAKADKLVSDPDSPNYQPDPDKRRSAARSLMQTWENQKAEKAQTIRTLGPLEVLRRGLEAGRITQSEFEEHQSLARDLEHNPNNHKRMTEIVFKSLG